MKITQALLNDIFSSNYKANASKRLIVMINYAPIVLCGDKPAYYCITETNGIIQYGYVSDRRLQNFEIKSSFADFLEMLQAGTIAQEIGWSENETPESMLPYRYKRTVKEVRMMCNLTATKARVLNFITDDYEPYTQVCSRFRDLNIDERAKYKLIRYALLQQTNLDSFVYFHGTATRYLSVLTKLHNTVISNFRFMGAESGLRNIYISSMGSISEVDTLHIPSKELNEEIQISIPFGQNVLNSFEIDSEARTDMMIDTPLTEVNKYVGNKRDLTNVNYNVVGLAVVDSDFSKGGVSSFEDYRPLYNYYLECFVVNIAMYHDLFKDKSETPYSQRFEEINNKGKIFYKPSDDGDITLRGVIAGVRNENSR